MYIHNINPTLLHLGPLEIRWYGLVYVFGFLLSAYWLQRYKHKINLNKEEIWDLLTYIIVGLLIGARIFMIFWQPQDFLFKPWNLLKIWEGGMSFHGGLIGTIIGTYIYCKKNNINFFKIADLISTPAIFALALGRVANFINGELIGNVTSKKWCVIFPDYDNRCRHPSTLYAAGKRFMVTGWLVWLQFTKEFKPGFIFWNLILWDGLGRILIDFFRENNLFLKFSLGQWLSLVMVIIALYVFNKNYREDWRKVFN